jgi:hypothetical protein
LLLLLLIVAVAVAVVLLAVLYLQLSILAQLLPICQQCSVANQSHLHRNHNQTDSRFQKTPIVHLTQEYWYLNFSL